MKIAVIEDEIRIREGLSRLIGRLGPQYEIAGEAENGKEGLALVRETKPDLIITDIKMSEMDGLEMLEALEREKLLPKVIVLSAYSEFEYARKAMRMGVSIFSNPSSWATLQKRCTGRRKSCGRRKRKTVRLCVPRSRFSRESWQETYRWRRKQKKAWRLCWDCGKKSPARFCTGILERDMK